MELALEPVQVVPPLARGSSMGTTTWCNRSLASTIVALSIAGLWLHGGQALVPASELGLNTQAVRVDITIKARQFHPSPVSLPVGQQAVLIFNNQDVKLHAFVPQHFERVPVQVDGNGAPEFGEKGLVRVLIPSGGREEQLMIQQAGTETGLPTQE